jgi:hypothetical protein
MQRPMKDVRPQLHEVVLCRSLQTCKVLWRNLFFSRCDIKLFRSGSVPLRTTLTLPFFALMLSTVCVGQQTGAAAAQPSSAPATQSSSPTATTPPASGTTAAPAPLVWKSTTLPAAASGEKALEAIEADPTAAKPGKPSSKKAVYSGPTDIIVLPATPMLDEEGRQRLDPDGKPMFNLPVKQQRDKFGHPMFDEAKKPMFQTATELGYDEHGKKLHVEKEKPPKMIPMKIVQGTFTVDGVTGKAALNYDIADLKYIYMYVPGIGIAVVSNLPFPAAKEQANAFDDKTLTVSVEGHKLELASDDKLLGKKPESAYVRIDRSFALPSRYPVVGYGPLRVAPYAWPGAKKSVTAAGALEAPPLPKDIQPVLALSPCPTGQMRLVKKALPGQAVPDQPCVPIPKGSAGSAASLVVAPTQK